ncbi:MAG TPA: gamma-glutamyl-gamma-aminobutyrate hydrolase family protein [Vicinamibacterales bacterium]|jgi:putative glutamine amidotransferase
MPPIIGVAPCRSLPDYVEAVRRTGGEPRVLDPAKDRPERVIGDIDGLLLTGGVDIDPIRYGEARHEAVTAVEPDRDEFEFALLASAREAKRPVFGICRGLQVMNVASGGTLVQDLAAQMTGILQHTVATPPCAIAHDIWVSKGSRLWTLMQEKMADAETCSVNSRHHQAIKRIAPGFEVTATAPDGVIEAIECQNSLFCLGVQWHPENFWRTGEFRPLFEGFIEACRK